MNFPMYQIKLQTFASPVKTCGHKFPTMHTGTKLHNCAGREMEPFYSGQLHICILEYNCSQLTQVNPNCLFP